jgi:uncharacterized protein (TIGR02117 family)
MKEKIIYLVKAIAWTIGSLLAFVLLYLAMAYLLPRIVIEGDNKAKDEIMIYLKSNGVHTDLVLPVKSVQKDWSKEVKYEFTKGKDTTLDYLGVGWGDKGFYLQTPTWAELKASVAFKAVTGLSTTALHTTFMKEPKVDSVTKKIYISKEQYQRLIDYIENSVQKDSQGHFINIKTNAQYNDDDAFYEAKGSYSLFTTCNTWTNNALASCGQKHCLWTPFDTGILNIYK